MGRMIKSGVENIYPIEVETCLNRHDAVAESAGEPGEGGSAPVEAERGDAVGPELEAPLEGRDR